MKSAIACLVLASASAAFAQGGTGAPSNAGQAITPEAQAAAEKSVEQKHAKRVAKKAAKKAKAASAAASQ